MPLSALPPEQSGGTVSESGVRVLLGHLIRKFATPQAGGSTNALGQFTTRGHRGRYEVSVAVGGTTTTLPYQTERDPGILRVGR